jgi:subtilisin family serine protease
MEGSYNAIEPGTPGPDGHGHSHHVSGIIAAQINNQGVVGVAPDVILYCCKVISDSGSGQWSSVITAIVWCIQKGIQVINCSFGGMTYPGEALEEAFQAAADAGIISICSAGNSGAGADTIGWPAKFPSCHAITALGPEDSLASYSSTGPAAVCIAPGSSVKSTYKENGYATMSGTSMSAPFVAGMMALAIEAGISDPVAAIATSCIDLGATGRDNSFGWGLLMADQIVGEGETPKLPRAVRANGSASTDPDGDPIVEWFWTWGNGATTRSSESVVDYTYAADGTYTVSQICWDDKGGVSLPVEQTIMVEQTDQENQPPISVLKVTSQ